MPISLIASLLVQFPPAMLRNQSESLSLEALVLQKSPVPINRSTLHIAVNSQPKVNPLGKWSDAAIENIQGGDARTSNSMASFSVMTKGKWKTTFEGGDSLLTTWNWGPGRHSIRATTTGTLPSGDPWNVVTIYYWHPVKKEVRSFWVSPFSRGVGEGSIVFDGKTATGDYEMFQSSETRNFVVRWNFEGPDLYRDRLLERTPRGAERLAEWPRIRVPEGEKVVVPARAKPPKLSHLLKPLTGLLGVWDTGKKGERIEFRYIPDADTIVGRLSITDANERPLDTDLYLYHHTGKGKLRWFGFSVDPRTGGAVMAEGDIVAADGRKLNFTSKDHRDAGTTNGKQDIELDAWGALRYRAWPIASGNQKPVLNIRFKKQTSSPK